MTSLRSLLFLALLTPAACGTHAPVGSAENVDLAAEFSTVSGALTSDGFIYPLGNPNGWGYGVTQSYAAFGVVIKGKYHTGADIGVPCGKPVYATSNGTVSTTMSAASSGGWGNVVIIRHDLPDGSTVYSQYAHLTSYSVGGGQDISKGSQLGISGTTGNSTGCHLHFEIKKNSNLGPGYSTSHPDSLGYFNPGAYIDSHKSLSGGGGGSTCCGIKIGSGEAVIDEQGNDCFEKFGTPSYWHDATDKGWGGHMYWTYTTADPNADNWVRWKLSIDKAGKYRIDAYIPGNHANAKKAKYEIRHKGNTDKVTVDQSPHFDVWITLGEWDFDTSCDQYVRLDDNTGEPYNPKVWLGIDAIRVKSIAIDCGNCDDGNPCTDDHCDAGKCKHDANGKGCDDGNSCTTGDHCDGGSCKGTSKDCSGLDGACKKGACQDGGCIAVNAPGACDDGDGCTTGDSCEGGACKGTAKVCDEQGPCMLGSCSGGSCKYTPTKGACDDGDPCTIGDSCATGACVGTPKDCTKDAGPCQLGTCQGGNCAFVPKLGACDDGDPCTDGDACQGVVCKGATKDCDDWKECTEDICVAGLCIHKGKAANGVVVCGPDGGLWEGDLCLGAVSQLQVCACGCTDGKCKEPVGCDGKICGDDGCGVACGTCQSGLECFGGTFCAQPCPKDCAGKQCGGDGCGGNCGECGATQKCVEGLCLETCGGATLVKCDGAMIKKCEDGVVKFVDCAPQNMVCHFDSGNGTASCGPCVPDCYGKECGSDGCDGTCGTCDDKPKMHCDAASFTCRPDPEPDPDAVGVGEIWVGDAADAASGDGDVPLAVGLTSDVAAGDTVVDVLSGAKDAKALGDTKWGAPGGTGSKSSGADASGCSVVVRSEADPSGWAVLLGALCALCTRRRRRR